MSAQQDEMEPITPVIESEQLFELLPYHIDMSRYLIFPLYQSDRVPPQIVGRHPIMVGASRKGSLSGGQIPLHRDAAEYHSATIAQYALAHWNLYLETNEEHHRLIFMSQAHWLVTHAIRVGEDAIAWPIVLPHADAYGCLSALSQGCILSVLVRAYQLTHEEVFLEIAHRVVRTFERDILDGGVSAPVGGDGVFFEEVAVYPAAHTLTGFIFALFGLYDYVLLTGDASIEKLVARGLVALHNLLGEFDAGFWTRSNLLHRRLASPDELALQAMLLESLAKHTDCDHCATTALRWKRYQQQWSAHLRYVFTSYLEALRHELGLWVRARLFPRLAQGSVPSQSGDPNGHMVEASLAGALPESGDPNHLMVGASLAGALPKRHMVGASDAGALRVCIPVTSFPFTGGILTVLEGIAWVTRDIWHIEYLSQIIGPDAAKYIVHRFGTAKTAPWHFPFVWFHALAGAKKLVSLLREGAHYQVIMPQDGLFTAAFSALVGKLAGIRVICIDHSTLTWPTNLIYRAERIEAIQRKPWHWTFRLFVLLMLQLYWPSLSLLARFSARFVDHFLIPGVPGDEVEEVCQKIGVPPSRLTRFASMIDVQHHTVFDPECRARMREQKGIAANAIVVAIICRLEAEKGLEVAMESISRALSACSCEVRSRVQIVIAGDGLLRKQLEEDIQRRELSQRCVLWGDIPAEEVISLLGISDIFLYTSTRGACFPMAVLEAMASGCAVIASTQPIANAHLLAEGRGIAVPPGDAEQTAQALLRLMNDLALSQRMGKLARNYVALHHSPDTFRRTLMRVTNWSSLDEILNRGKRLG